MMNTLTQIVLAVALSMCAVAQADNFASYMRTASDHKQSMNARWGALVKAASQATPQQLDEIRKFSEHKDWYMRNAALVALRQVSLNEARSEARRLVTDKALVVRSAAVDVLTENLMAEDKDLLITELNKPYNFNKKSSLWIRKQIVEKLSAVAAAGDKSFFAKTLFDADKGIAEISVRTLAKLTGQPLDQDISIQKWQNLAKEKNWL